MSNAAALYTVAVSVPSGTAAVPDDTRELKHHLKDGKGFRNPWDSWHEPQIFKLFKSLAW